MDPLSVAASAIAVGTLAARICQALAELRSLCKTFPGRLQALSGEVADFEAVLYQVAAVLKERARLPTPEDHQLNIPQLLKQATSKLHDLSHIVDQLTVDCDRGKNPISRASSWRKKQGKLQALQEDIKTVKCSLNIMLGASNS